MPSNIIMELSTQMLLFDAIQKAECWNFRWKWPISQALAWSPCGICQNLAIWPPRITMSSLWPWPQTVTKDFGSSWLFLSGWAEFSSWRGTGPHLDYDRQNCRQTKIDHLDWASLIFQEPPVWKLWQGFGDCFSEDTAVWWRNSSVERSTASFILLVKAKLGPCEWWPMPSEISIPWENWLPSKMTPSWAEIIVHRFWNHWTGRHWTAAMLWSSRAGWPDDIPACWSQGWLPGNSNISTGGDWSMLLTVCTHLIRNLLPHGKLREFGLVALTDHPENFCYFTKENPNCTVSSSQSLKSLWCTPYCAEGPWQHDSENTS